MLTLYSGLLVGPHCTLCIQAKRAEVQQFKRSVVNSWGGVVPVSE